MNPTKLQVLDALYRCIDEVNSLLPAEQRIQKSPQTTILSEGKGLDSLAFINFVASVEQICEEEFGKHLVLTDVSAETDKPSIFRMIDTLADFIHAQMDPGDPSMREVRVAGLE